MSMSQKLYMPLSPTEKSECDFIISICRKIMELGGEFTNAQFSKCPVSEREIRNLLTASLVSRKSSNYRKILF